MLLILMLMWLMLLLMLLMLMLKMLMLMCVFVDDYYVCYQITANRERCLWNQPPTCLSRSSCSYSACLKRSSPPISRIASSSYSLSLALSTYLSFLCTVRVMDYFIAELIA